MEFDDIQGGEPPTTSNSGGNGRTSGDKKLHIKGTYGTVTHKASDGCDECRRNASVAIIVEGGSDEDDGLERYVVLSCPTHRKEIVDDHSGPRVTIKTREF